MDTFGSNIAIGLVCTTTNSVYRTNSSMTYWLLRILFGIVKTTNFISSSFTQILCWFRPYWFRIAATVYENITLIDLLTILYLNLTSRTMILAIRDKTFIIPKTLVEKVKFHSHGQRGQHKTVCLYWIVFSCIQKKLNWSFLYIKLQCKQSGQSLKRLGK